VLAFKRKAKEYAAVLHDLVEIPHNYVKSQLVSYPQCVSSRHRLAERNPLEAAGTALPSLSSRILGKQDLTEELEDNLKWAAATMYQGERGFINNSSIL
jgi:hypothetical protein